MYVCAVCSVMCGSVTPMNLPGSSVHGILQARILEWIVMPSCKGSSQPRDWILVSCISCTAGRFFTTELHLRSASDISLLIYPSAKTFSGWRTQSHLRFLYLLQVQVGIKQDSLSDKGSIAMAMVPTWVVILAASDSFIIIRSLLRYSELKSG